VLFLVGFSILSARAIEKISEKGEFVLLQDFVGEKVKVSELVLVK